MGRELSLPRNRLHLLRANFPLEHCAAGLASRSALQLRVPPPPPRQQLPLGAQKA